MKVVSTNSGSLKEYTFQGNTLKSSMRRTAQPFGIKVTIEKVIGDEFSSPQLHGLVESAVYALSAQDFNYWSEALNQPVEAGNFGENLTLDQMDESQVMLGSEYQVGSVRLKVSGPRYPCNRLNYCFGRADAQQLFTEYARPGVYFRVLTPGEVKPGDVMTLVKKGSSPRSVHDAFLAIRRLKETSPEAIALFQSMEQDQELAEMFRSRFRKALAARQSQQ